MKDSYGKFPKSDQKVVIHLVHAEKKNHGTLLNPS